MEFFKAIVEISNSVNDDEYIKVKYFASEQNAKDFILEKEREVEEWNKPEESPSGGRMSTRYIYTDVSQVDEDTELNGLTFGDLHSIIRDIINTEIKTRGTIP